MKKYTLWWTDKDNDGELPGGEYATLQDAMDALPAWHRELLGQMVEDEERKEVTELLQGFYSICVHLEDSTPQRVWIENADEYASVLMGTEVVIEEIGLGSLREGTVTYANSPTNAIAQIEFLDGIDFIFDDGDDEG